ncbi:MAG: hypothetical protein EOP10_18405 [Proteobacteria bacterium]|nr:MAG: hypothetical protein EOP10_18405 [Pseudomonadota bacterium]
MSLIAKSLSGALASLLLLSTQAFGLQGSVSADYVKGFEPGDPVIGLALALSEPLNKKWTLSLSQDVTKNLVIDSENEEWIAADTRLGLSYRLSKPDAVIAYTLSASLSLPLSKASQHAEIYSKPMLSLGAAWAPSEWLTLTASAFVRDTISAYETLPAENGEGGSAIADYNYGISHSLTLTGGGFSGGYSVRYVETRYPKQDRSEAEANGFRSNLPDQGYDLTFFISRDLWTNASVNIGYIQGTALVQEGYEDYVIFDSAESLYTIGFLQAF